MPGLLKTCATCPKCKQPLVGLVDTTNSEGVTREYFHAKPINGPRPAPCKTHFDDYKEAQTERRGLEANLPRAGVRRPSATATPEPTPTGEPKP